MELRDYLLIIGRRWTLLVTIIIFSLIVAGYLGFKQKSSYDGTATISVVKSADQKPAGPVVLKDDNLSALQASGIVADIVAGWFFDPTVIHQIYEEAKIPLPPASLLELDRVLKTKRLTGTSVQVITKADSPAAAERLAATATQLAASRIKGLVEKKVLDSVEVITSAPLSAQASPPRNLFLALGAVIGVFLGLIAVFAADGLKSGR